jgi:hypothetical protein
MGTERDARQLISRCVSIVARYHRLAKTWPNWGSMVAEIRAISTEANRSDVALDRIPPLLLARLLRRYDRETAERLRGEFVEMLAAMPAPARGPRRSTSRRRRKAETPRL